MDASWQVLGPPTVGPHPYNSYGTAAAALLGSLVDGRTLGHAWRDLDGSWRRVPGARPTGGQVAAHVAGAGWLSPFQPVRAWPYVVLDVDLHHAAQVAEFDATMQPAPRVVPVQQVLQELRQRRRPRSS